jgi:hypothetical protein
VRTDQQLRTQLGATYAGAWLTADGLPATATTPVEPAAILSAAHGAARALSTCPPSRNAVRTLWSDGDCHTTPVLRGPFPT